MKLKIITFTVQIQADINERPGSKEKIATELCEDINRILTKYDGMLGGAQIIPKPNDIKITSTPKDYGLKTPILGAGHSAKRCLCSDFGCNSPSIC